jgi:hypothetical protein
MLSPSNNEWKLDVSGDFNARQLVLRTQLRVKNNREEPIDFLAKAILICYNHLPPTIPFC